MCVDSIHDFLVRSLWSTATPSCMNMRLYKFSGFEYDIIKIFKFSGGGKGLLPSVWNPASSSVQLFYIEWYAITCRSHTLGPYIHPAKKLPKNSSNSPRPGTREPHVTNREHRSVSLSSPSYLWPDMLRHVSMHTHRKEAAVKVNQHDNEHTVIFVYIFLFVCIMALKIV